MKKIVMFVYGTIATDARVQRAATCFSDNFDVLLLSVLGKKRLDESEINYHNEYIDCGSRKKSFKLFFFLWECLKVIKKEKPDMVYAHDYYSVLLLYWLLRLKKHPKLIYDAHELIIPNKHHDIGRRLKFFSWFEKSVVRKVDLLICASKERGEKMKEYYGLENFPLVIRNISQLTTCGEVEDKALREKLDDFFVKPGLTLVYAGAVTKDRRIDRIVDVAVDLMPVYKLLVIGDGGNLENLKSKMARHSSLISLCTGALPYNVLGSILCKCDVGYIYYPTDSYNNIYCASNKLYEYASISLPMLSNENPTLARTLKETGMGVACEDYKQGLIEIAAKKDQMKHNCKVFTENNKWENESEILLKTIWQL